MAGAIRDWESWVLTRCQAGEILRVQVLQELWGGYGQLMRLSLRGGPRTSVILKRVLAPSSQQGSASDRRKRRSYEIEQAWYEGPAARCEQVCRVATCLGSHGPSGGSTEVSLGDSRLLLLEDLELEGYHPARPPQSHQIGQGLRWLAQLHARFLGPSPPGLWPRGSYWHLQTRREEWERMPEGPLKEAAPQLDRLLAEARFQTVLHGDAKPANFCWSPEKGAAAVDFQYVGGGCGIRDVAYFLDCCLDEHRCQSEAEPWLAHYFSCLNEALAQQGQESQAAELEAEWRALYPVAWSDYQRFYQGWSRRPSPLGPYSQLQLRRALRLL
jgi:hypothetical protein